MAPLLNPLATLEQYVHTPSRADGLPAELEEELRVYGCQLIQEGGTLLRLPQRTMATAQVLFQRFWFVTSMRSFSIRDVCTGALFLSTKLEETPIRLRDLINVMDYLIARALHYSAHSSGSSSASSANPAPRANGKQRATEAEVREQQQAAQGTVVPPFVYKPQGYHSQDFYDAKDAMVVAEMQILKRLGFNVQVNLPYATLVNYLQLLGLTDQDRFPGLAQRAWSFLNDALQTPVYCLYPPHTIACASVYLSALTASPPVRLPDEPAPWFALFDAEEAELRAVCAHILRLYDDDPGGGGSGGGGAGGDGLRGGAQGGKHDRGGLGLAARVREERGGLARLLDRRAVRAWLEEHAPAPPAAPAATAPQPWVLKGGPVREDYE